MAADIKRLLHAVAQHKASDLHLQTDNPPTARVNGTLAPLQAPPLTPDDIVGVLHQVATPEQIARIERERSGDFGYLIPDLARFRVNAFYERGRLCLAFRLIPLQIPTFEELGVPSAAQYLAERDRGLVLVVGAAGNGKSSTLAAMIGHLNRTQALHIVTIEDPIEFLHADDKSSVSQREVGIDTLSFPDALRGALRQDPDVILVGEIRDEVTLDIALKAAETGHLVMSTLHTPDVARTVGRMLALAPKNQPGSSEELRERIGDSLQGIIAQRLLPNKDGTGLVLAAEVLVATGTVRETIKRPVNNPPLKELMEKGVHPYGMQTFEMHLRELVKAGLVDKDFARQAAAF